MDTTVLVAVIGLVGIAIGALVNYLISKRKNSGNIDSSEAGVLWEERRLLTQELREEVKELRDSNTTMNQLNQKQGRIIADQAKKITMLENRLAKWESKK